MDDDGTGRVVGVLGARGGAGATLAASLLAAALARSRPVALVDLGPGPGIDLLLGTERQPGARWPDLAGARGTVDHDDLTASLPRWSGCAVLGPDPSRPGPVPDVVAPVLHALRAAHPWTVLDLGRLAPARDPVVDVPAEVVGSSVVPRDVPAVLAAGSARPALRALGPPLALLLRGPAPGGLGTAQAAAAVDLPLLGTLPASRTVAARIDRGYGPGGDRRLRSAAERVAARLRRWLA
jgi:secretion/DNA translocation related CpaE-like protein